MDSTHVRSDIEVYFYGPQLVLVSPPWTTRGSFERPGPNVDGLEIRRSLEAFGVSKLRSSPYHPQGDGQAERSIQTVKQTIRCILSDRQIEKDCWPAVLQEVAYTLNLLQYCWIKR